MMDISWGAEIECPKVKGHERLKPWFGDDEACAPVTVFGFRADWPHSTPQLLEAASIRPGSG